MRLSRVALEMCSLLICREVAVRNDDFGPDFGQQEEYDWQERGIEDDLGDKYPVSRSVRGPHELARQNVHTIARYCSLQLDCQTLAPCLGQPVATRCKVKY